MRLEDVTAEIRPRVPWESIDLGCALACKHIGSIWKAWMVTVVPLWILLAVLLRNHPFWFMVCTWWLKPLYDRVPLFVVSRALFGAVPSTVEVMKAWPKLLVRRLWFALVVGRFSPARCLSLPVSELEGLRGAAYRQRVSLLERNGGEGATSATLAGLMLESVAAFGMVMLVFMMVPGEVSERWAVGVWEFLSYSDWTEITAGLLWAIAVVRLLSFMFMEPFYVSAGFALYVNSRTLTEGWDIELAFKRMGARLRKMREGKLTGTHSHLLVGGVIGLGMMFFACDAQAQDAAPDQQVSEILADEDFTVHHRIVEVPKESSGEVPSWLDGLFGGAGVPAFMGVVGSVIFYLVLAAIIAGLVYLIYQNRHIFSSGAALAKDARAAKTREVMGMNVTPESLPDDIAAAAREAWRNGNYQLALSLLYRGSIAWFVHKAQVPIEESDTEGDCLRHVEELGQAPYTGYFSGLTNAWIRTAYGKQQPDDHTMVELCDSWPFADVKGEGRQS